MVTRRHLFTLLSTIALLVFSFSWVQPAYAGWNGQQLSVQYYTVLNGSCGSYVATEVRVSGPNQDGSWANWSTPVTPNLCGRSSVTTWGWWWEGKVNIEVKYRDWSSNTYISKYCTAYVPTRHGDDVYTIGC